MSKIQITELNSQTSKFHILNQAEIAEVVGGYSSFSHYSSWNSLISSGLEIQIGDIKQINGNQTFQVTVGDEKYSFTGQYKNGKYSFVLVE
jgi:hypothetical protein